ncbi:MAG: hypothetical protein U5K51_02910 [Flavobacteriaceae bacterium]|nr:hypothetical protein [Flavobacteriaceae bacterium]
MASEESVEDMVDYYRHHLNSFTLGLIELQVYKNPNSTEDLIVIPNLLTRTREITRAIIKIENATAGTLVKVETAFSESKEATKSFNRNTITEDDFFEQLTQNTDKENQFFKTNIG